MFFVGLSLSHHAGGLEKAGFGLIWAGHVIVYETLGGLSTQKCA